MSVKIYERCPKCGSEHGSPGRDQWGPLINCGCGYVYHIEAKKPHKRRAVSGRGRRSGILSARCNHPSAARPRPVIPLGRPCFCDVSRRPSPGRDRPADASRGNNGLSRDRASIPQRLLLVFQLALSIVLLTSASLATRSLYKLEHQRTGIETEDRYTVQIDLKGSGYASDQLDPVYRKIEDGLSALPEIARVTFARYLPLEGNEWGAA